MLHSHHLGLDRSNKKTKEIIQRFAKFWLPVLIYLVLIFVSSSLPGSILPEAKIPSLDKILHTIEYAVLGFLLIRGLKNSRLRLSDRALLLLTITLATIYGITDEFHQYFVPGRSASLGDVFFDCIGSAIGGIVYRK